MNESSTTSQAPPQNPPPVNGAVLAVPASHLTLPSLAAQAESYLAGLANALTGEVGCRHEVFDLKAELSYREAALAQDERIDGKNAEVRQAQLRQLLAEDPDVGDIRRRLRIAEREHLITLAQIEMSRERVRTVRALLSYREDR